MNVYINSYKRSPIGGFLSKLSSLNATELSLNVVNELLNSSGISPDNIDLICVGNVLSTGLGQNIARNISIQTGIKCPGITINRVCSSGIQAIIEGYNSILLGKAHCVIVGGVESMSNSPHYTITRKGSKFGDLKLKDSMMNDGLIDMKTNKHMGVLTEELTNKLGYSRKDYDNYAKLTYTNARNAVNNNLFKDEIVPISVKKDTVCEDEEINKVEDLNKLESLRSVFQKNGSLTAGNCSKLSDGACFLILCSEEFKNKHKLSPVAKIIDYELSSGNPEEFSIEPLNSMKSVLQNNNIEVNNIDLFEINEAFPIVPIHLNKTLNVPFEKINILGGAIAMGHPLGCSGARIVSSLITALRYKNKKTGCASICNGGGGSTSMLITLC